jgi:hypothetical protein
MGLLKTAGHVAVAKKLHGRVSRRQSGRWAAAYEQTAVPSVSSIIGAPAPDHAKQVELLRQLTDLHRQGVLSDIEFAKKKAEILAE